MNYTNFYPCNELKPYISHFWMAEWDAFAGYKNDVYYVTASSQAEMVFGFEGDDLLFSALQGQTKKPNQFCDSNIYKMFGVSLYSYAIPYLFHIPALDLNDQFISTNTLFSKNGDELNEMLLSKTNFLDRIQILSNFFLENLKNQRFGDPMVLNAAVQIKNSNNNVNVKNLAKNYCLSQKQFERRFKVGTGFNPKLYARIIRFEKLMKNHATFKNFTQAAYSTGYYDQSHLIRDFKDFTGYDPYQFIEICGY